MEKARQGKAACPENLASELEVWIGSQKAGNGQRLDQRLELAAHELHLPQVAFYFAHSICV